jgi:L-alanine-DL-glutamate epimerase-like enolase superfamily enzyme
MGDEALQIDPAGVHSRGGRRRTQAIGGLCVSALCVAIAVAVSGSKGSLMQTDIRPVSLDVFVTMEKPRMPLKFGNVVMRETPFVHVRATVENLDGDTAEGWGGIFLSDVWAWPDPAVEQATRHHAMMRLVDEWARRVADYNVYAHPIDIWWDMHDELRPFSEHLSNNLRLPGAMPHLASLVCASPVDAALHDGFGKVNRINSYNGYGRSYVEHDLSRYLGKSFKGAYLSDFLHPMPASIEAFHLVGGLDKLTGLEITDEDPKDGLPVTLEEWILYEHLHCLKVKLRGTDLEWDINRMLDVARVARQEHARLGLQGLWFSADTNEQCSCGDYMVDLLRRLGEQDPALFEAILYVEQPCHRNLRDYPLDVSKIAALKPVVIDESLMGMKDLELALDLGYSGAALKTCKGHSSALLTAAECTRRGIVYTVQDLTNPAISLAHSVSLAAHLSPLKGVETNSRQFFPATNEALGRVHPGLTKLRDGNLDTTTLGGVGLGYQWEKIGTAFEPTA